MNRFVLFVEAFYSTVCEIVVEITMFIIFVDDKCDLLFQTVAVEFRVLLEFIMIVI
jgi:hypothetical protein